jgi:membrane-associated protease RseP (regulator of RpoE activity)
MSRSFDPEASPSPCRRAGGNLVNCDDCGREISSRAVECVHCGRPRSSCGSRVGWIMLLVVMLGGFAWFAMPRSATLRTFPPVAVSSDAWDQAMQSRPHGCGFLGVMLKGPARDTVVSFVAPDSPAQQSGLRAGDRILKMDGRAVAGFQESLQRIWAKRPGDRLTLTLGRGSTQWTIDVTLDRHPND